MNNKKLYLIIILLLNLCYKSLSQELLEHLNKDYLITEIENLDDINYDFYSLSKEKINLNQLNLSNLKNIPFINSFQLVNLIDYIKESGVLYSIYEIKNIKGFDEELIKKIIPYISLEYEKPKFYYKDILRGRSRFVFRYKKNNKHNHDHMGDQDSFYFRYLYYLTNSFGFSILGEKDYGESFFGRYNPYAFDHYSFSLFVKNFYSIDLILIGAYRANFGQGLIFSSNYFSSRNKDFLKIINLDNYFKSYLGRSEKSFFNGIASTISIYENLKLNILYSDMFIDTNVKNGYILSIYNTGYHRTKTEINNKNNSTKKDIGYSIRYQNESLELGINLLHTFFDKTIKTNDLLKFNGKYNFLTSFDYLYTFEDFIIFGETAVTDLYKYSSLNGIYINLELIEFIVKHTYIDKQFNSFYKNADVNNKYQNILNTSFKIKLTEFLEIKLSYDIFNTYVGNSINSTFSGEEFLLMLKVSFNEKITLYSYFYDNLKQEKLTILQTKRSYLYNINNYVSYNINDMISTKVYLKNTFYEKQNGFFIYNDIKLMLEKFNIYFRYGFFDISSWDTRIYAYENDLQYEFYNPVFYDKGINFMFLTKYKFNEYIKFSSKISYINFLYKDKLDKIEFKFLLDIKF